MARDTNIITLVGRLTRDPEISQTQNGIKMAKFTLASSDDYKKKNGEEVKRTNFIQCEAFGGIVEVLERYTQKGKQVLVIGKMYVRESTNKEGKKVWYTGVTVDQLQLLGTGQDKPKYDHAQLASNDDTGDAMPPFDFDGSENTEEEDLFPFSN